MKSVLFRRFDLKHDLENRFVDDLADLLSLSPEDWASVVDALPALVAARTPEEQRPVIDGVEDATGIPVVQLSRICKQAQFFLSAYHTDDIRDESPSLWAEDLKDAKILRAEDVARFIDFMSVLKMKALEPIESLQRRRSAEAGVLPSMTGSGTTVELRGVFEERYKYGRSVEEYAPKLTGMAPIISVAITVDSGPLKTLAFQGASQEIGYLIAELQAALKCAQALVDASGHTPAGS